MTPRAKEGTYPSRAGPFAIFKILKNKTHKLN
jgi:hypothetical protein